MSSCTTLAGNRQTKLGIAQKSCELGVNSCTCVSSGTLSILTCRQKKHAIEVLGRVLTAVVVLRCICVNVMTFSRVHKCNPNACHTLKMHQMRFLTKGLFFARSPNQRIPRVPRAPKARAKKNWRYCGVKSTNVQGCDETLLSVKADYLKRSVLERRHCFIVRQKCDIFTLLDPHPRPPSQKSHFFGFFRRVRPLKNPLCYVTDFWDGPLGCGESYATLDQHIGPELERYLAKNRTLPTTTINSEVIYSHLIANHHAGTFVS